MISESLVLSLFRRQEDYTLRSREYITSNSNNNESIKASKVTILSIMRTRAACTSSRNILHSAKDSAIS